MLWVLIVVANNNKLTKSFNRFLEFDWRDRWQYQIHVSFLHFQSFNSWYRACFIHRFVDKIRIKILINRTKNYTHRVNWIIQSGCLRRKNHVFFYFFESDTTFTQVNNGFLLYDCFTNFSRRHTNYWKKLYHWRQTIPPTL